MKKETKLQELERRILALEQNRTITIIDQRPISTMNFPQCTCNVHYNTPTRPPCPIHGSGMYPYQTC